MIQMYLVHTVCVHVYMCRGLYVLVFFFKLLLVQKTINTVLNRYTRKLFLYQMFSPGSKYTNQIFVLEEILF